MLELYLPNASDIVHGVSAGSFVATHRKDYSLSLLRGTSDATLTRAEAAYLEPLAHPHFGVSYLASRDKVGTQRRWQSNAWDLRASQ